MMIMSGDRYSSASAEVRRSRVTAALVDAINSADLRKCVRALSLGADIYKTVRELQVFPGLNVRVPNYDLVNLSHRFTPKSILGCAVLQSDASFVRALFRFRTRVLPFPVYDKLLALEHCSVEVLHLLLLEYGPAIGQDGLEWSRWRRMDFLGNLLTGALEKERVVSSPLNVVIKTLGYSCRMASYYGDGVLHQQVAKLRIIYSYGDCGRNLLVSLVHKGYKYVVANLLKWGVLRCGDNWEELTSMCIRYRIPLMFETLLEHDTSMMPSSPQAHLTVLREDWMFTYLNAYKLERFVRLLIDANFPFYGQTYDACFEDTVTKIMLLHFAGVEVTDHQNITANSMTYNDSLTFITLRKLPIAFETVSEAATFAKTIMTMHQPKSLAFLCKLHIRKYLRPCQNNDILQNRVNKLPLPPVLLSFIGSSFI